MAKLSAAQSKALEIIKKEKVTYSAAFGTMIPASYRYRGGKLNNRTVQSLIDKGICHVVKNADCVRQGQLIIKAAPVAAPEATQEAAPEAAPEQKPKVMMKEALRRIEEAKKNRATRLDLSCLGLEELPPEIGQLTRLEWLSLYGNQLTALPREIGQLTRLKELYLSGNQLTALPREIGQLTRLEGLSLYGNQLTALPREIGQLTRLEWLSLYGNQLTDLPPEIGKLVRLKVLSLYGN